MKQNLADLDRRRRLLRWVMAGVLLYSLTIWIYNFADVHWLPNALRLGAIFVFASAWGLRKKLPRFGFLAALLAMAGCFVLLYTAGERSLHSGHVRILAATVLCLALLTWGGKGWRVAVSVALVAFALVAGHRDAVFQLVPREQNLALALLGAGKFVLLGALTWRWITRGEVPGVFASLLLLLVVDLLPAAKIHTHLSLHPFYRADTPFPARRSTLDIENFRVNNPNSLVGTPLYRELYRGHEALSNLHIAYGLRTYGGYVNTLPRQYHDFISAFAPPDFFTGDPDGGRRGFRSILTDGRFQDLAGVAYDFDTDSRKMRFRPTALSRFMLFEDFEVEPEEKAQLAKLRDLKFNPHKKVLLFDAPGFSPVAKKGVHLSANTSNPDRLQIQVQLERPAILLFGDSHHDDWKAKVDDSTTRVLRANYNFMAIALPAGSHRVTLSFEPRLFYLGLRFARAAMVLFLLTLAGLLLRVSPHRSRQLVQLPTHAA